MHLHCGASFDLRHTLPKCPAVQVTEISIIKTSWVHGFQTTSTWPTIFYRWQTKKKALSVCLLFHVFVLLLLPFLVVNSQTFRSDTTPEKSPSFDNSRSVFLAPVCEHGSTFVGVDLDVLISQGIESHADHKGKTTTHDGHNGICGGTEKQCKKGGKNMIAE